MSKYFVSNKDESVRMFNNDFLNSLSKVHFAVPLFIFLPVVLYFLYVSVFTTNIALYIVFLVFVFGVIGWTLTEYLIHRFVFHYHPKSEAGKRFHFMMHGVHHDYPNDSKRLVLVPGTSIPLAIIFYFIFYYSMGVYSAPFYAGFVAGYLFYDMTHYALHHYPFKSKFWADLKKHHMIHHYQDSDHGFGVSSKVWDHLCKTMFKRNNL